MGPQWCHGIDDAGQPVGLTGTTIGSKFGIARLSYSDGVMQVLGTLANYSEATGTHAAGQAGRDRHYRFRRISGPDLYSGGVMQDLVPPGGDIRQCQGEQ